MKKMFKASSLLFYLLCFVVFTILGTVTAGLAGAGDGQGLAGGAIVLGYGVMTGFGVFVLAIIAVYSLDQRKIVTMNKVLGGFVLLLLGVLAIRILTVQRIEEPKEDVIRKPSPTTQPVNFLQSDEMMGLGFFAPQVDDGNKLYFYNNPFQNYQNLNTTIYDSLVFMNDQNGNPGISYAPPWLLPEINKLDYGILYFRVLGAGREYIEIEVNVQTHQTAFIQRQSGMLLFWPDFLLGMHSVEFNQGEQTTVRIKPLSYAGEVIQDFEFMRALEIKEEWMMVALLDTDFKEVGKGWIQWRAGDQMLINYNLLS
ncbi:hypothetical protein [Echinicola sp. 20G]|uniref:hypothetical protein n=1 Tax=Echinicola sp. 20G TaxID=2781961 RepID=UPI0019103D3E|nr:hypothetical protein [Echinicola sp. 20G]